MGWTPSSTTRDEGAAHAQRSAAGMNGSGSAGQGCRGRRDSRRPHPAPRSPNALLTGPRIRAGDRTPRSAVFSLSGPRRRPCPGPAPRRQGQERRRRPRARTSGRSGCRVPRQAERGQWRELGRPLSHGQDAQPTTREPASKRADRQHAQQRRHGSADAAVSAATDQRPPVGEHRPLGHQVQNEVVRLPVGEVLAVVVDDLVGTERAHEVELAGVVDAGHVCAGPLGQLDRERPGTSAAAVDKHATAGGGTGGPLQGDRTRLRDGRCLGEAQPGRLRRERGLVSHRVLRKATLQRQVVAIHLFADSEMGDPATDFRHPARDVRTERGTSRGAQTPEAGVERRSAQTLPVGEVDRRRGHLHQHLSRGRSRHRHVVDAQHVWGAIPEVAGCSHRRPWILVPSPVPAAVTGPCLACGAPSLAAVTLPDRRSPSFATCTGSVAAVSASR